MPKAKKSEVWFLVKKAFPNYSGRKFRVEPTEKITFHSLNWSGGSRNEYVAVSLSSEGAKKPDVPAPWMHNEEGSSVVIPEGFAIICHSFFCGTDCGITVYVNPANVAKFLDADCNKKKVC